MTGALQPVITEHQAAITDPSQVARLMQLAHAVKDATLERLFRQLAS